MLYASAGQVNFLVPASVLRELPQLPSLGVRAQPPATIAAVAPALFTLNAAGLVAGYVVRVSQGSQTVEPISDPIDLGPTGGSSPITQVYLCLFGTGIRGAPAGQVSVHVQGIDAPVIYAGPQKQFAGLDQVNVLLPIELAGTGDVGIVLTAGEIQAPTVRVSIK